MTNAQRYQEILVGVLIHLGAELEPEMAKLLAAGIEALVRRLAETHAPPDTLGVVAEIVSGLEHAHPDWSPVLRREYAAAAVAGYVREHGGQADAVAVNALIELAVVRLRTQSATGKPTAASSSSSM